MTAFHPTTIDELQQAVAGALGREQPLAVSGGGSKHGLGGLVSATDELCLDRLTGVVDFEPAELILTALAGTPLAEIESLLAERGQMLAFEPVDWRGLLGNERAVPTLGGALGCNLAGPRRIKAGAARDHFLGFSSVNGFGETFKAGGKVVKNVTGYDLCKLLAGSYGTLSVLAEVTLKVMPRPDESMSLLIADLDDLAAIATLADGLNSPHEVSAAAHLPEPVAKRSGVGAVASARSSITALRLEGPGSSIAYRAGVLRELLASRGDIVALDQSDSERLWREIGEVKPLLPVDNRVVWRLSVPPASGPGTVKAIERSLDAIAFYDWAGGLIWLGAPEQGDGGAATIRAALAVCGGHATLIRAPDRLRASVPVFEPLPAALAALTRRVKDGFDPKHLFNPGRLYPDM
jgi:glycolate oxidase FAD binding subunit